MLSANDKFCSQMSQEAGEQLYGTSNRVAVWFLLEYNRPWGSKAYEESDLPPAVRAWIDRQLDSTPQARLQLIKGQPRAGLTFCIAVSDERAPLLYRFALRQYEDLLALDVPAILAGRVVPPVDEKLFLVCTNGKRDRCCALFGLPVYSAMRAQAGDAVWQTTHTGGHRFAATLYCFPHGLGYGRVQPQDAAKIVDSYREGRLLPEFYRGRSCYEEPAQVAEYLIRQRTGIQALAALRLVDLRQAGAISDVEFVSEPGGLRHRLRLAREESAWRRRSSCDKDAQPAMQYRLLVEETS